MRTALFVRAPAVKPASCYPTRSGRASRWRRSSRANGCSSCCTRAWAPGMPMTKTKEEARGGGWAMLGRRMNGWNGVSRVVWWIKLGPSGE